MPEIDFKRFDDLVSQLKAIEQEYKNNPDYFFGFRVYLDTGEIEDSLGWLKKKPGEPVISLDELLET